jgi:ribosomal protein L36
MRRTVTAMLAAVLAAASLPQFATSASAAPGTTQPSPATGSAVARDDYVTAYPGNRVVVPVLSNDGGQNLTIQWLSCPQSDGYANYSNSAGYDGSDAIGWVPAGAIEITLNISNNASFICTYGVVSNGDTSNTITASVHVNVVPYKEPKAKIVKRHGVLYAKVSPNNPPAAWANKIQWFMNFHDAKYTRNASLYHPHHGALPTSGSTLIKIPKYYLQSKTILVDPVINTWMGAIMWWNLKLHNKWYKSEEHKK